MPLHPTMKLSETKPTTFWIRAERVAKGWPVKINGCDYEWNGRVDDANAYGVRITVEPKIRLGKDERKTVGDLLVVDITITNEDTPPEPQDSLVIYVEIEP